MTRLTLIVLIGLVLLFTLGLWHAWPLTSVVFDENYFAGGVLRSLQAHSIFPQGTDVPYGSLTFYGSYLLMLLLALFLAPFAHFSLSGLANLFLFHPWLAYLPVRVLSLLAFAALLILTERFWSRRQPDEGARLSLLAIIFTALLPLAIVHTGKVWVLSTFLLLVSFMSLVRPQRADKAAFISIITAFAAFANFPIMGFALINLPILFWQSRTSASALKRLALFALVGLSTFALVLAANFPGIHSQVASIVDGYTLSSTARSGNLSLPASLVLNLYKTLRFFPILIIALFFAFRSRLKDKPLAYLSLVYLAAYVLAISLVARWSTSLHSFVRYLLPVPFLLGHLLAAFEWRSSRSLKVLAILSLTAGLYLTSLVIKPTTFNQAYYFVTHSLENDKVLIENQASPELTLPMNKESYELLKPEFCGSLCRATVSGALTSDFKPIVITQQSKATDIMAYDHYYLITKEKLPDRRGIALIASFQSGVPDGYELIIDNIADYFDPAFWQIRWLGRNIYIYKIGE